MSGADRGRIRRWRRLLAAGAVFAAGLGVWAWQASVHEARVSTLKEQVWKLVDEKARIGVATRRRAELEKELSLIEQDLVRLRPFLPETFDVAAFVAQVERRYGVEVLVVEELPAGTGAFESRELSVVLFGDRATTRKLPGVGRFVSNLPVFWWKLEEEHDSDAEGVFTLFALPVRPPAPPEARTTGSTESTVGAWLWPYARKEAELVAKREALRQEVGRDEALRSRLRLFETRKAELQACVDTLNALIREPSDPTAQP